MASRVEFEAELVGELRTLRAKDAKLALVRILGWVEHCQRELPGTPTMIPVWLCTFEQFQQAVDDGYVEQVGLVPLIPREGMNSIVYGLSDKGREKFYAELPRA